MRKSNSSWANFGSKIFSIRCTPSGGFLPLQLERRVQPAYRNRKCVFLQMASMSQTVTIQCSDGQKKTRPVNLLSRWKLSEQEESNAS
eukprot:scaffold22599_cov139-Cylindrotheca_fusiformis.AAC.41